jgi:hypothetical protein
MRSLLCGCACFCGDALAARAFISFARPKETNQRKAAGSISEAKNRMIFPKTGKRSPLRSVWTSPFLHGKITRFSLRLSEEAGIGFSGWDGCSVIGNFAPTKIGKVESTKNGKIQPSIHLHART